jgi:hypothetical protein
MSREAFEHWYADHTGDAHIRKYCDSTGRYQFNAMQSSWEAWQAAQAQAVSVTKNQISEGIFGWGLRNDDGHNLSVDDTDEIAEYIMKQAAQDQAELDIIYDDNGCPTEVRIAQAQAGEGGVTYRCVICNMSGTDDGLCDAHKYEHEGC